jgi:hypothetical protein
LDSYNILGTPSLLEAEEVHAGGGFLGKGASSEKKGVQEVSLAERSYSKDLVGEEEVGGVRVWVWNHSASFEVLREGEGAYQWGWNHRRVQ